MHFSVFRMDNYGKENHNWIFGVLLLLFKEIFILNTEAGVIVK